MRRSTPTVCLLSLLVAAPGASCTIISGTAADGGAWAGNNEDYFFDFDTYLNVSPRHGKSWSAITFTYDRPDGSIQGGVNEEALFFDFNTVADVPVSAYGGWERKRELPGGHDAFVRRILESCTTVADVLALLERYRFPSLLGAQLHLADAEGNRAVVNAGAIRVTREAHEVSTNFNVVTNAGAEGDTCWRFPIAQRMLAANGVSQRSFRDVLDATRQRCYASTIYSNIVNLQTELYLYYAGDFDHPYRTRVADLLASGRRSYLMRSLFPGAPIVRVWEAYRSQGAAAALELFHELRGLSDAERAELLRHVFLSCLLYTHEYASAARFYEEWRAIDGGRDQAAGMYGAWVRIVQGDLEEATKLLEAQIVVEQGDEAMRRQVGPIASEHLSRLRGERPPGANTHLALERHGDAKFVGVYTPGYPAVFRFLLKTARGWEGDFALPPGKTHYAFVVDGRMIIDPANPRSELFNDEGIRRRMSVRIVRSRGSEGMRR